MYIEVDITIIGYNYIRIKKKLINLLLYIILSSTYRVVVAYY